MKPIFEKVAILGLGLIGGSLALDLKRKKIVREVVGYNRSAAGRRDAKRRRACDRIESDPRRAVLGADLVVLAVPVGAMAGLVKSISKSLAPGCLVTDVGSTKEEVVKKISRLLPKNIHWVGGHPIAGTEHSGMVAAEHNLFRERWWLLTPNDLRVSHRPLKKLVQLLKQLGAKIAFLDSKTHDHILAGVSHLPHMLAFSLMEALHHEKKTKPLVFAGRSFRDMTRIVGSSPEMWADISLDNSKAILDWVAVFQQSLKKLSGLIRQGSRQKLLGHFKKLSKLRKQL